MAPCAPWQHHHGHSTLFPQLPPLLWFVAQPVHIRFCFVLSKVGDWNPSSWLSMEKVIVISAINLNSSLGAGPVPAASMQLGICLSRCKQFSLPARYSVTQGGIYMLLCCLHQLLHQEISGENKNKWWEKRARNRWSYVAGLGNVWGQVISRVVVSWARKRYITIFLEASHRVRGCLVLFRNKCQLEMNYIMLSPETALEWINSELQSERKAYNIYIVSSRCPWKCRCQHWELVGSPAFSEDVLMQTRWE